MQTLKMLATGEGIIYIATRLFDFAEKIKAEDLEKAVLKGIERAMRETGVTPEPGAKITFVPYRDTTQNVDDKPNPNSRDLNETIHLEDLERLNHSFALIGFFDGLSKDEGVSMEIGYAYGIESPIILGVTDFIRCNLKGIPNSDYLFDPVIESMAKKIKYKHNIPKFEASYKTRLQEGLKTVYKKIEEEAYLLGLQRANKTEKQHQKSSQTKIKYEVCIDFGGGLFEWQRILQERLARKLYSMGFSCIIADRYSYHLDHPEDIIIEEIGKRDIKKVKYSKLFVACSDSAEMNCGTAALQGYSRALGKKILLYDSKTINIIGDNNYRSSRNLMIDYSANTIVTRFDDLASAVEDLLRD